MNSSEPLSDARAPLDVIGVDVLVVGAGITGIYQLYRAREAGFSALLLEAGGGGGGTRDWEPHPGAPVDPRGLTDPDLFSPGLFDGWGGGEDFAPQTEIQGQPQPRGH